MAVKLASDLLFFQVPSCNLSIGIGQPVGIPDGIFRNELHKPLFCYDLRPVWQRCILQFLASYPLTNCAWTVSNQWPDILWCQRIRLHCPYSVEKVLKVIDVDLGDGIDALAFAIKESDRSSNRFRCCFQHPEVADYIIGSDFIAPCFLSSVLAWDSTAVEKPFCFAFANVTDTV